MDKKNSSKWVDEPYSDNNDLDFISKEEPNLRRKNKSTFQQKIVFSFIIILSITALGLGFMSYAKNIKGPFVFNAKNSQALSENLTNPFTDNSSAAKDILALSSKDTDKDGLSDYDELYNYNTSPYLADSDSDGFSDKQEIDSGHDPNCPVGKNCGVPITPSPNNKQAGVPNLLPGTSGVDTKDLLSGNLSSDELRILMPQLGIPKEQLSGLSDEELRLVYKKTLEQLKKDSRSGAKPYSQNNQTGGQTMIPGSGQGSPGVSQTNALQNLTSREVRDLLIKGGVDKNIVDGLSDEDLMNIYKETLSKLKK